MLLLDVTPLSLGIETEGGIMTKLVERNTTIPAERKQTSSALPAIISRPYDQRFPGERPMARDNRLAGTEFNLEGLPPAPRGVPQIEVKFDIDANGILNVSAKDLGTGKEQTVRIEQSSGLTETKIERKERRRISRREDKRKRNLAEAHNQAESMCFQLEKMMKENAEKLSAGDKGPLENGHRQSSRNRQGGKHRRHQVGDFRVGTGRARLQQDVVRVEGRGGRRQRDGRPCGWLAA